MVLFLVALAFYLMIINLVSSHSPPSLSGPVLADSYGLPRYWAVVWSTAVTGALADSTHVKKLRYIDSLYRHADELRGPGTLGNALGALNDGLLAEILESWFISIRNQPKASEADETRWQVGLGFVTLVVSWIAKSDSHKKLRQIESRRHQLSVLYSQFRVKKRNAPETTRSLPASTVEVLYALLDPESKSNPFPRIPDYQQSVEDPRHSKPSIKTKHSIRQIPVSETTAQIIDFYADNWPTHSFLLNSKSDVPLSTEALTKAFSVGSKRLPSHIVEELEARTGKTTVTPHDLRHTCAVVCLHQLLQRGDSMDEALQKMRTSFGWSRESTMPSRYARAVFEDRLAGVWNNAFDDRVALLRALPKGY